MAFFRLGFGSLFVRPSVRSFVQGIEVHQNWDCLIQIFFLLIALFHFIYLFLVNWQNLFVLLFNLLDWLLVRRGGHVAGYNENISTSIWIGTVSDSYMQMSSWSKASRAYRLQNDNYADITLCTWIRSLQMQTNNCRFLFNQNISKWNEWNKPGCRQQEGAGGNWLFNQTFTISRKNQMVSGIVQQMAIQSSSQW